MQKKFIANENCLKFVKYFYILDKNNKVKLFNLNRKKYKTKNLIQRFSY